MATIHKIKIKSVHFNDVLADRKTAEVRFNDRDYQVGDVLYMEEVDENGIPKEDGKAIVRSISHVLHGGQYGIAPEFCVLSFVHIAGWQPLQMLPILKMLADLLEESADCMDAYIRQHGNISTDVKHQIDDAMLGVHITNSLICEIQGMKK
ncbi:DUF3850 domain-containing protein [Aliivibrio fischeri]|uniref:DUF3850 domain-containing protein n=1 Tax=Aliivibrio fischeri TaxID=668 RepID=UPI0012D98E8A|nr:DUF3850 domain-containing protein [Aliivibrio fischeri]MUK91545.1 DUF3850 domain-containing protein [Aliivibrio fischeri]